MLHVQKAISAMSVKGSVSKTARTAIKLSQTKCIFRIKVSHYLSSFSTQY